MAWPWPPPDAPPADDEFVLVPLTPDLVDADLDAVLASREQLLVFSDGAWPHEGFTREENLEDLVLHDDEHRRGVAYTWSVVAAGGEPDRPFVLGCVYVRRAGTVLAETERRASGCTADTALVAWWVRPDRADAGLDLRLVATLRRWAAEWPVPFVFTANPGDTCQITRHTEAGLLPGPVVRGPRGRRWQLARPATPG